MGLFGGGSSRGINTGALRNILEQGLKRQRSTIEQGYAQTPELGRKFEQKQGDIGQQFVTGSRDRAMDFGRNLENIDTSDMVRERQAKAQELAFRNVPAAQQAIRENLAATGGLGRGAAIRALSQPVLQASQQAADQGFAIQTAADEDAIARREQALGTLFNTEQGANLQKLGIDQDTARTLLENGRADILNRAMQLADIEAQRTQGLLDIETLAQQQAATRDAAKRQQFGNLIGGLGSIGGAGIGALVGGGPMGALIGSQLGGQLGGFAGGGTPPDLTSALTLMALRNRANAKNSYKSPSTGKTLPGSATAGTEDYLYS